MVTKKIRCQGFTKTGKPCDNYDPCKYHPPLKKEELESEQPPQVDAISIPPQVVSVQEEPNRCACGGLYQIFGYSAGAGIFKCDMCGKVRR